MINFARKFIDKCSIIAKPLTDATGGAKGKLLSWTPEMERSYDALKYALQEEVILSFPDYSEGAEKLELFVDASGSGAGGCLFQKQNDSHKPIGFASMAYNDAQRRYSTIERELVAIHWGVKAFRSFIFGVPFVLYTDH
jgi:hypothetical protein